jgi:hypothetical protein
LMKTYQNPLDLRTYEVSSKGQVAGVRSVASRISTPYPSTSSNSSRKP